MTGGDAFETASGITRQLWQVQNTGILDSLTTSTLSDGGVVIAKGRMGFWESTELYSATRPDIWGNLCGQPIRHHKMPDVTVNNIVSHFRNNGDKIVLLGVQFEGITHPLDLNGNPTFNRSFKFQRGFVLDSNFTAFNEQPHVTHLA